MKISELADHDGVTTSSIRYYERIGLLPAASRTGNGYRDYDDDSLARVVFVTHAKRIGLTLEVPANFSKVNQPTEDKMVDIIRGRRPVSDLDQVVSEWRSGGGEEGRTFFAKALSDNGR